MGRSAGSRKSGSIIVAASAAAALACACGGLLFALDWPVSSPRLVATFGTPAKGRFIAGAVVAGADPLVRAAAEGELVFWLDEDGRQGVRSGGLLPSALGSCAVVEHPRGLVAVYARLEPGSVSSYLVAFKAGTILGKAGSSGWAEGPGLLLQVFDRREGVWVNPLLLLPSLVDTKAPLLPSMALVRGGRSYVLGQTASLPQGTYEVAVEVSDPQDAPWTLGPPVPYSIRLSLDGAEIARDLFDVAAGKGGKLTLFPHRKRSFAELRRPDGRFVLAERLLARGRALFEVVAEDAAGNRRAASWSVVVE